MIKMYAPGNGREHERTMLTAVLTDIKVGCNQPSDSESFGKEIKLCTDCRLKLIDPLAAVWINFSEEFLICSSTFF